MLAGKMKIIRHTWSAVCGLALGGALAAASAPDPATVYAWFKGDHGLGVAADGYSITTWTNLGTAGTNAIAPQALRDLNRLTRSPQKLHLLSPDGSNTAAIRFSGTDGIWSAKTDFGIISTNRTLVLYARVLNAENQGFLFDATSFTPGLMRAQVKAGFWHVGTSGGASSSFGPALGSRTSIATINVWQVHTFIVVTNGGGAKFQHFINGVQVGDVAVAANGSLSGLMLGANAAQQFGIQADVAEVLVFDRALDNTTRARVESYLSSKWAGVIEDPNAPPPPAQDFVPVFVAGESGYNCFRIPALVMTTNGTVIAVADGRLSGCGDIPNPLDLVAKRSFDNGRSWGPLQVIANYGSDPNDRDTYPQSGLTNIVRVAGGDAALLLDRTNGRVWVLYDNGASAAGKPYNRVIKLEMRYSDDDGATWSLGMDIEALNPGLRPTGAEFLAGPGNGIQLENGPHAGRLIFPAYMHGSGGFATLIYSDDHGQTWQLGGNAGTGGGEVQIAETAAGGLIASMRDNGFPGSGARWFNRSTDGGLTWGSPFTQTANQSVIPDPACQGNVFRLTTTNDSNASRLLHANTAHTSSRVNMTLRLSYDDGQTWPVSHLVYAGGSAYSSVTRLASGEVGLFFEKDPYGSLYFTRRSVAQISAGADALPPYTVWAGERFSPAQLMNPAISGPDADPDGDGFSNHAEFVAGTDPLEAASRPTLNLRSDGANAPRLNFPVASNKSYTIQSRKLLVADSWERYVDIAPQPTSSVMEIPVSVTNAAGFFRLATPQLP